MDNWLPQHKALVVTLVVAAAVFAGLHFYFVQPLRHQVDTLVGRVRSESRKIREGGWSTDESRLLRLKTDEERELERLASRARDVWQVVGETFAPKLADYDGDELLFMDQVTRLDYADAYTNILRELEATGRLNFDPSVLRLGEDSVSPHVYEMVLQLWTLDEVMRLALQHSVVALREQIEVPIMSPDGTPVINAETGQPRVARRRVSQVALPKPRQYLLTADDQEPYLLEIPLLFKAQCTPRALHDFLVALSDCGNGRLLVVNRFEVFRLPPDKEGQADQLQVQMEVAAFIRLRGDLRLVPPPVVKPLPRGA